MSDGPDREDIDEDGPTVPDSRPSSSPSAMDGDGRLRVGARVGRYQIEALIGEGAMGGVYRAHRPDLDAHFAVKVMSPQIAKVPGAVERFVREAKAAARVRHDHVVRVVDTGVIDGLPYLVMEYLEGRSLEEALEGGALTPSAALAVILPVIAATDAAHAVGVVHRDLKPANVFLSDRAAGNAAVKVVDFGISKMESGDAQITQTGEFVGTPGYAAPEQLRSARDVGPAADQYAIGVMLYEALSGEFPFAGGSSYEIIHRVLSGESKPLDQVTKDLPADLVAVVSRAMSTTPEARYPSLAELASALMPFADESTRGRWSRVFGAPGSDDRSATATKTTVRPRRRWWSWGVAAAGIVAGIAFLASRGGDSEAVNDDIADDAHVAPVTMPPPTTSEPLRLGLDEGVPYERLRTGYTPLAEYLQGVLGRPVELVTLPSYARVGRGLDEGDIDIAWLPPFDYVRAREAGADLELLAKPVEGADRTTYQGVIVARAEENAPTSLSELEGGTFCYVNPTSSSGYLYPRLLLRQNALDPDTLFASTRFVGSHNALLPAIHAGQCDAGATSANMLYEAQERVGLAPTDFKILASTESIPYGPYVASGALDERTLDALRAALLALPPGSDAADHVFEENASLRGFERARDEDYDVLRVVRGESVD